MLLEETSFKNVINCDLLKLCLKWSNFVVSQMEKDREEQCHKQENVLALDPESVIVVSTLRKSCACLKVEFLELIASFGSNIEGQQERKWDSFVDVDHKRVRLYLHILNLNFGLTSGIKNSFLWLFLNSFWICNRIQVSFGFQSSFFIHIKWPIRFNLSNTFIFFNMGCLYIFIRAFLRNFYKCSSLVDYLLCQSLSFLHRQGRRRLRLGDKFSSIGFGWICTFFCNSNLCCSLIDFFLCQVLCFLCHQGWRQFSLSEKVVCSLWSWSYRFLSLMECTPAIDKSTKRMDRIFHSGHVTDSWIIWKKNELK